jgi:RNA polymerase sigma-70 factor (ECF subfamily)
VSRRTPIPDSEPFVDWLARLRSGDRAATVELVRRIMPVLRRLVRTHLAQTHLSRVIDPLDVCQATMATFFARLSSKWPPAESRAELTALLVTITRNKLWDEVRRQTASRRDHRRVRAEESADRLAEIVALDPSPSSQVAHSEQYQQAIGRLTAEERQILEARLAGRHWADIASDRGLAIETVRQRLNRGVQRVRRQLLVEARQGRG